MDNEYFGIGTNLVISLLVTIYGGFAWLPFQKAKYSVTSAQAFRQNSYLWWWLSWLCWTLLWLWTGIRQLISKSDLTVLKIPDLVLDNLNCICLVLVFMIISRGDGFGRRKIFLAFTQVAGSLTVGFAILYALSHWLTLDFTYGIHNAWSLCMSAAGPILVGWAVYLRFNSVSVLAIGFVYGFIQPVAYAFDLQTVSKPIGQYQPVVDITLAGLKILWAVVFMQILAHGEASGVSLVAETNNPGLRGRWIANAGPGDSAGDGISAAGGLDADDL